MAKADGILALFGAPIALEDAPQRALRSAIAIHQEIAKFNVQREGLYPIKMRIGVHTGPVVVGTLGNNLRVEFKAVGDTVNLASRMEALAEPGTTYVTEDTFKLTEGLFRFETIGEKTVKGKQSAIPVYKLLSAKKYVHRPRLGLERSIYSEMVGRDKELNRLELQVMKAINGEGSIVNIIGERSVSGLYGLNRADLTSQERSAGELDKIRFHKREGDFDRALSLVNKVLEKEEEFPEALYLKAQILWEGFGNRSAAASYLERTMQLAGEGEPLYRWASGYLSDMDPQETTDKA